MNEQNDTPIDIRPENPGDAQHIRAVHVASFPTAAEGRLVDALRAAGTLSVSLVGVVEDAVVGHVAFSPVTVAGAADGIGLAPVAVLPDFRRRGIADRLIRAALEDCKRLGSRFVVVLGDPRYYGRFGFEPAAQWGLTDEYGGGNAFQALELQVRGIPSGGGVVRYAAEFAVLEDDDAE